jgi:hypothetical protein
VLSPPSAPTTAAPSLTIGSAKIGEGGVDVRVAIASAENEEGWPARGDALLLYASNTGCPSYESADAQARSGEPFDGWISDAFIGADAVFNPARYSDGTFTLDVMTGTVFPTNGSSPFSTVCAMRYSGRPGSPTPARPTSS